MDRVSALNYLLVAGKRMFRNADQSIGQRGTEFDQAFFNGTQEAIVRTIERAGLAPSDADYDQFTNSLAIMFSPLIGTMSGARAYLAAAGISLSITANQVVVGASLGGITAVLNNLNLSVSLSVSSTGAGFMDTGTAPTSGYVAIYAIYNPATSTAALLAVNATSSVAPPVYAGTHMPAGFTLSGLVSVWRTTAGGLFAIGSQLGHRVSFPPVDALSTGTQGSSLASVSIAAVVPPNAKVISGNLNATANTGSIACRIASDALGTMQQYNESNITASSGVVDNHFELDLVTPQTMYAYYFTTPAVTSLFKIQISSYSF